MNRPMKTLLGAAHKPGWITFLCGTSGYARITGKRGSLQYRTLRNLDLGVPFGTRRVVLPPRLSATFSSGSVTVAFRGDASQHIVLQAGKEPNGALLLGHQRFAKVPHHRGSAFPNDGPWMADGGARCLNKPFSTVGFKLRREWHIFSD